MAMTTFCDPSAIRARFSAAMSEMYRHEVPAYGTLIEIVEAVNRNSLDSGLAQTQRLEASEDLRRISAERHGAIRLGTANELSMIARIFAVMGMEPVGYYDLSVASVPVHSTAFRPTQRNALAENPFRVFTSLLRLELIENQALRQKAADILAARKIFTDQAIELTKIAERRGGLGDKDADDFAAQVLETFRWHATASVDPMTFEELKQEHRLIADIVSFKGPHINHLTPRTLDIDAAQASMLSAGLPAKAVIEGPPRRKCPILLRQTAFKALEEIIYFPTTNSGLTKGHHTARFGEIEQRGIALTPKGRALYDQLLQNVRAAVTPEADGSNTSLYTRQLEQTFADFPDDWRTMHDQELAYFKYEVTEWSTISAHDLRSINLNVNVNVNVNALLDAKIIALKPIIYEDFLPVSAAGIFQSNLADEAQHNDQSPSSRQEFEAALGRPVLDEFALYTAIQSQSLAACLKKLQDQQEKISS